MPAAKRFLPADLQLLEWNRYGHDGHKHRYHRERKLRLREQSRLPAGVQHLLQLRHDLCRLLFVAVPALRRHDDQFDFRVTARATPGGLTIGGGSSPQGIGFSSLRKRAAARVTWGKGQPSTGSTRAEEGSPFFIAQKGAQMRASCINANGTEKGLPRLRQSLAGGAIRIRTGE